MNDHLERWLAFDKAKREHLALALGIAHTPESDNFQSIVLRLFGKADRANFALLAIAYPDEAAVVAAWNHGLIKADYRVGE